MSRKKPSVKKPDILAEYTHQQVVDDEVEDEVEEIQGDLPAGYTAEADASDAQELTKTDAIVPALSSHGDPLKAYMRDISKYALLTPEEELKLALELSQTGSLEAARRLVCANLRLVVKIAMEYRSTYSNVLDLIQEGNVGLMKAVSKFDNSKGAKLSYYASWWIRSYILKYILDNFRLVKIGTTQAQKKLFYQLMREKDRLEAQGYDVGPKLLADRLHVKEKEVVEMSQRLSGAGAEMSLQTPLGKNAEGGTSAATHQDLLVDETVFADDRMAKEQLLELLKEGLPEFEKLLKEKELAIFRQRLAAEDPKTLQETADLFGLTRERARQIEAQVIQKLRNFYASRMGL